MNPKEAIEIAREYVRSQQRLDGLGFRCEAVEVGEYGKIKCMLVSEVVKEDVYPIVKNTLCLMIKGHWVNALLHHIEHLEGENRDLWNELQKGKDDA